jgi:hypothetical protein
VAKLGPELGKRWWLLVKGDDRVPHIVAIEGQNVGKVLLGRIND